MQVITTALLSYKVLRVLLSPVKTKQTSFFSCKNLADQKELKVGGKKIQRAYIFIFSGDSEK